jgi:hypothetical protein
MLVNFCQTAWHLFSKDVNLCSLLSSQNLAVGFSLSRGNPGFIFISPFSKIHILGSPFEALLNFYQTVLCYIPGDSNLHKSDNLRPHIAMNCRSFIKQVTSRTAEWSINLVILVIYFPVLKFKLHGNLSEAHTAHSVIPSVYLFTMNAV